MARRVYLDKDSIEELAWNKSPDMIIKLLAVLIGFHEGTAQAYATEGEVNELGEIDEKLVHQEVKWNV